MTQKKTLRTIMHPTFGLLTGTPVEIKMGDDIPAALKRQQEEGRYNLVRDAAAAHELLGVVFELAAVLSSFAGFVPPERWDAYAKPVLDKAYRWNGADMMCGEAPEGPKLGSRKQSQRDEVLEARMECPCSLCAKWRADNGL